MFDFIANVFSILAFGDFIGSDTEWCLEDSPVYDFVWIIRDYLA